jgi:hypothetical protein
MMMRGIAERGEKRRNKKKKRNIKESSRSAENKLMLTKHIRVRN